MVRVAAWDGAGGDGAACDSAIRRSKARWDSAQPRTRPDERQVDAADFEDLIESVVGAEDNCREGSGARRDCSSGHFGG